MSGTAGDFTSLTYKPSSFVVICKQKSSNIWTYLLIWAGYHENKMTSTFLEMIRNKKATCIMSNVCLSLSMSVLCAGFLSINLPVSSIIDKTSFAPAFYSSSRLSSCLLTVSFRLCLSVYTYLFRFLFLFLLLSSFVFDVLCLFLSTCLSVCLSVQLSIYSAVCTPACLFLC